MQMVGPSLGHLSWRLATAASEKRRAAVDEDGPWETVDGKRSMGNGRWETGNGRRAMGDGRRGKGVLKSLVAQSHTLTM
jgi:hypothetical protein